MTDARAEDVAREVASAGSFAEAQRLVEHYVDGARRARRPRGIRSLERSHRWAERTEASWRQRAERERRQARALHYRLRWARFIPGLGTAVRQEAARHQQAATQANAEARWWKVEKEALSRDLKARQEQRRRHDQARALARAAQQAFVQHWGQSERAPQQEQERDARQAVALEREAQKEREQAQAREASFRRIR